MTTHRRFDFSFVAITLLLAVQATVATVGFRMARNVAVFSHQEIVAVTHLAR